MYVLSANMEEVVVRHDHANARKVPQPTSLSNAFSTLLGTPAAKQTNERLQIVQSGQVNVSGLLVYFVTYFLVKSP